MVMHLAICIWGILRASVLTYPSLKRYLLDSLKENGHSYDIVMHTYSFASLYTNRRSQEFNLKLNFSSWMMYNPNYILIEDQDKFDRDINYELYKIRGDPWSNQFSSFHNELRALNSLMHVSSVVESIHTRSPEYFQAVIFVRPDVMFLHKLPIMSLSPFLVHTKNIIFTPDFHRTCFGGQVNDRFAIGQVLPSIVYGTRLQYALQYSQKYRLHSEKYLYYHLKSKNIKLAEIPFRFKRIRASGKVEERDAKLKSLQEQKQQDEEVQFLLFRTPYLNFLYRFIFKLITYPWMIGLRFAEGYAYHCHPFPHLAIQEDLNERGEIQSGEDKTTDGGIGKKRKILCQYRKLHLFVQSLRTLQTSVITVPYNCSVAFY